MFRCCPPKWGPWGPVGPRKLAKLMVTEGLTDCVGLEAEGGAGHGVRALLTKWEEEKPSQTAERSEPLVTRRDSKAAPGDRAPAARGQHLVESRAPGRCVQALARPADTGWPLAFSR